MNRRSNKTKRKSNEAKFELFHIRLIARLCIGFACFVYFVSRLATIKGIIQDPSSSAVVNRISLIFAPMITLIALLEYLLYKKKGKKILKYSDVLDILTLSHSKMPLFWYFRFLKKLIFFQISENIPKKTQQWKNLPM